jgi:hypothetical protein
MYLKKGNATTLCPLQVLQPAKITTELTIYSSRIGADLGWLNMPQRLSQIPKSPRADESSSQEVLEIINIHRLFLCDGERNYDSRPR